MGINIDIVAAQDGSGSSASASGEDQHIITDAERKTFGIEDRALKAAVGKFFGKAPNDAYVCSPTPWGDLYQSYGWPQVKVILTVERAEILEMKSTPVIVKTQTFTNDSKKTGVFNVGISDSVQNTTSSNWSTGGTLTIGQKFNYGVTFLGAGAQGETSLSYSQSWGVGGQQSTTVTIGSTAGVSVTLEPGEGVTAKLSASRGNLKAKIDYRATLVGCVAVNYNPTWKDHHFWALDIAQVMAAGGIDNASRSSETIDVAYYSDSKIKLEDPKLGNVIETIAVDAEVPGPVWTVPVP